MYRILVRSFLAACLLTIMCSSAALAEDGDQRILQLKQQIVEIQNDNDLGISSLYLCSKITGFSSFVPLENNTIPADGKFMVYYEPTNWFTKQHEGRYEFSITQDMRIKTKGEVIFQREKLLAYSLNTRRPVMDLYVQNTLDLATLPEGEYIYEIVLKDVYKEQEVTTEVPFVVPPKPDTQAPAAPQ